MDRPGPGEEKEADDKRDFGTVLTVVDHTYAACENGPKRLEHYPTKWNHLTGMIFNLGEARFAWRCGASAKKCNDAMVKKHPACGGANRFPGFVAALARKTGLPPSN